MAHIHGKGKKMPKKIDEDWFCCECPKSKARKHEELWSFGGYGNNPYKKEDALLGNQYCEEHFKEKEKELDDRFNQEK